MATTSGGEMLAPSVRMMEIMSPLNGKERIDCFKSIVQKNMASYKDCSFQAKKGDIFISTYPRCGTTWTQHMVKLIRNNGKEDGKIVDEALPWLELMSPEEAEAVPSPRGFKSHLPYNLIPGGEPRTTPAKYISVYRNPKDVTVSLYHHMHNFASSEASWNDFFEGFTSGEITVTPGNCFDFFLGWWEHKDDENILVLSYEWMKANHREAVETIAKFAGYELEPSVVGSIVEQTTFKKMKTNPASNMSWMEAIYVEDSTPFLRKGEVGDWKNYFSDEQSARMDEKIKEKYKDTGLEFVYS